MNKHKREKLEAQGWKIGGASEFLQLSPQEELYIELRLALSRNVRLKRKEKSLTQHELAEQLGSSQSRVAKLEANDSSVSLDLLIRSLFTLGTSLEELSQIIASSSPKPSSGELNTL